MFKGILGRKVGMTQIFDPEKGTATPVTVIEAGPCNVLQVRTVEKDGYSAVQLGFLDKTRPQKDNRSRNSQARRSERGHVADIKSKRSLKRSASGVAPIPKAGCEAKRFVRELRGETGDLQVGGIVVANVLADVARVDVVGTSKGRGYSGVMRRHNFSGQRASHGVKKCHRHGGSTGMSAFPSRVFKGKRMAGQYGGGQVTARNLKVVKIDTDNNLLLIGGAVPGPIGGFVIVKETNKK
jgi:large subunit ribosomal protein L3